MAIANALLIDRHVIGSSALGCRREPRLELLGKELGMLIAKAEVKDTIEYAQLSDEARMC